MLKFNISRIQKIGDFTTAENGELRTKTKTKTKSDWRGSISAAGGIIYKITGFLPAGLGEFGFEKSSKVLKTAFSPSRSGPSFRRLFFCCSSTVLFDFKKNSRRTAVKRLGNSGFCCTLVLT